MYAPTLFGLVWSVFYLKLASLAACRSRIQAANKSQHQCQSCCQSSRNQRVANKKIILLVAWWIHSLVISTVARNKEVASYTGTYEISYS